MVEREDIERIPRSVETGWMVRRWCESHRSCEGVRSDDGGSPGFGSARVFGLLSCSPRLVADGSASFRVAVTLQLRRRVLYPTPGTAAARPGKDGLRLEEGMRARWPLNWLLRRRLLLAAENDPEGVPAHLAPWFLESHSGRMDEP